MPLPALRIAALAWPSCPVLAVLVSLQSLPSMPVLSSLHGKELLTEIRVDLCWSFSWLASCNVSFHTTQRLVFMQTSERHTSLRRQKAHGDAFPHIFYPFCGTLPQFLGSLVAFANKMPRAKHRRKALGGALPHHGKPTLIYQHFCFFCCYSAPQFLCQMDLWNKSICLINTTNPTSHLSLKQIHIRSCEC